MKPNRLLKSAFMLVILNVSLAFGQDNPEFVLVDKPFAKGNMYMPMSNNLMLSWKNLKTNDEDAGNRNRFGLSYEGTYFVTDNIGVGIGFSSKRTNNKNGDSENIEVNTLGSVHAMYGYSTDGILNIYGKIAVRGGVDKTKYDYMGNIEEDKYNEFGMNFEVGAPIEIGKSTGALFTPFVNYDYLVSKDDDYKDVTSGIFLGTRLTYALPCAAYANNCSQVQRFSENMYNKGMNVIGGSTGLLLNLGKLKSSYTGDDIYEGYDYEVSEMCFETDIEYYHYIINNVALGTEIRLRAASEKEKDTDYEQSKLTWMVKPILMANLPVDGALNNTYGYVGYGFGSTKEKTTNTNNNVTETKYANTELSIGAGYNLFFAKSFALVPEFHYSAYTSKNKDNDNKQQRNGPGTSISVRYSF